MIQRQDYAHSTYIVRSYPWGLNVSGAAMCSDGKVRKLARLAATADTAFSTPAAVRVNGRTVAGFVTVETAEGYSTETKRDPWVLKFVAVLYGKNCILLPEGSWRIPQSHPEIVGYWRDVGVSTLIGAYYSNTPAFSDSYWYCKPRA